MNGQLPEQSDVVIRLRQAFPISLAGDVSAVLNLLPTAEYPPSPDDIGPISVTGERLQIPFRVYSEPPPKFSLANLELQRQTVLSCIFTRHHNGYIRQQFTETLINAVQPWVVPFLVQLVGEYVCEIIQVLLDHLPDLDRDLFVQFAADNPQFIVLTQRRVISYWNAYYRSQFPRFTDYPGFQIMNAFDLWCNRSSRRLLSR
jgi:hypothetical protein